MLSVSIPMKILHPNYIASHKIRWSSTLPDGLLQFFKWGVRPTRIVISILVEVYMDDDLNFKKLLIPSIDIQC